MMIRMHRPARSIAKITEQPRSSRRRSPAASGIHVAVLFVLLALVAAAEQPNFVVIFADDLGYGDLGVYGSETIRTPNLDRMAAEGMRFTDFYATAPFCSPSRASLLTGRYPVRAGVPYVLFPTELTGLPPAEITIAELLSDEGYATAAIGKWHLGWPRAFRAQRHGFDLFYGLPYSNDMLKWEPDDVLRPQHAFWSLPLLDNDEIVEAPVNQHTLTRRYTERAVQFIRENRDRPFFLYFPHTFPHNPQYASENFEGTLAARTVCGHGRGTGLERGRGAADTSGTRSEREDPCRLHIRQRPNARRWSVGAPQRRRKRRRSARQQGDDV